MSGKWCYSLNEEDFRGVFDSREEALAEAKEMDKDYRGNVEGRVWIGKCEEAISQGVNIENILEDVAECTRGETCGDYADDYLDDVTNEHMTELEEAMNDVLFNWMDKHKYKPTWFEVDDVEVLYLGGE